MKLDYEETMRSWGWRIKRYKKTQSEFAKELGISDTVLSEYISGKRVPPLMRFFKIEQTLQDSEND